MSTDLPSAFFEHLVADGPDAVIYADAAGFIRYWNAAASRIFGFGEREAIGVRLDLIIPSVCAVGIGKATTRSWAAPKAAMARVQCWQCRRSTRTVDRSRSSSRFSRFAAMPGLSSVSPRSCAI